MNRPPGGTGIVLLLCCGIVYAPAGHAAAPTFQELMNPTVFPDAQRGMLVKSAKTTQDGLRVMTTGAEFILDKTGNGTFRQRIGPDREVLRLRIQGITQPPRLTHSEPGLAFAQFGSPKLDVRVNGDSLFMFHAHEPVALDITRTIEVGFCATYRSNCLVLDEWGGFGLFCSDKGFMDALTPYEPIVARYALPADGVLWIGICPPKPYDWERSFNDQVVWHWSDQTGYPPDTDLAAWAREGNIVLLQSEVMLWKDWNLAFVPRLGEAEFARVRRTVHEHGMRFIVYTSPYYFLKGTPLEPKAMNSFENFKATGFPPGWPDGVNINQFMDGIGKVITLYKPDGLYFDGQYTENVPALYALARRARGLLGEYGILEWHSTAALGDGLCFLPQADAYVDFILRGEGRDSGYANLDYLRHFVSGYNSSNSIGVLCNNGPKPTSELVNRLLTANCRMHTLAGWLSDPTIMDIVHKDYRSRLTPALRETVEKECDVRQGKLAERTRVRAAEQRELRTPPRWDKPLLSEKGDGLLQWTPSVSPANKEPFSVQNGALTITAKAHTYAFLTRPLNVPAKGVVIRMKQDSDGGMSWGPAIRLCWKNGSTLRIGLRSDGLLQADLNGEQRLFGNHDPAQRIWIRLRWLRTSGVVETSPDGNDFRVVWTFEHAGTFQGDVADVSVGKVPFNGARVDHSEPGPTGTCHVEQFLAY